MMMSLFIHLFILLIHDIMLLFVVDIKRLLKSNIQANIKLLAFSGAIQ